MGFVKNNDGQVWLSSGAEISAGQLFRMIEITLDPFPVNNVVKQGCIMAPVIQRILHQCNNWYILIFLLLQNALAMSTHYA